MFHSLGSNSNKCVLLFVCLKKATWNTSNNILYEDCFKEYIESMEESIDTIQPYYKDTELLQVHVLAKLKAFAQV